ncbi:MAG: DUF4416 family protein [Desulfobacterales bacterium]|nr:DUF4416 family protein [Desulfobacterales bacterium]
MSLPKPPRPAKLVMSLFIREKEIISNIFEILCDKFGKIDMISDWIPFDFTNYYMEEMGHPLFRRMISFKNLINQGDLPEIKLFTNNIENKVSMFPKKRVVNIDPGYLLLERFVLATGKNYSHRIYIGNNIYADLTLIYQKGGFKTLPWTYPDYAQDNMINFLEAVRKKYTYDLKTIEDYL